jgi:hypothetical protein
MLRVVSWLVFLKAQLIVQVEKFNFVFKRPEAPDYIKEI